MPSVGRNFHNLIEAFSNTDGSHNSQIPEIWRRWSAISAVAAVMTRRCWYNFGAFKVYPPMYIALLGEAGSGKTSSFNLPIKTCFKTLAERVTVPEKHWDRRWEKYGLRQPRFILTGKFTTEKMYQMMPKLHRPIEELNSLNREYSESPMTVATGEFRTLMNKNDSGLQAFFTDIWDNEDVAEYHTKTAGSYIVKEPNLNWIAGATRGQFLENMPSSVQEQGLLSRIIVVYYPDKGIEDDLIYYFPPDYVIDALTEDLAQVAKLYGEFKFESPEFFEECRQWIREGGNPRPTDPKLKEYCNRRKVHIIKLAMCYSAAKRDDLTIRPDDWEEAKATLLETEKSMPIALANFGSSAIGVTAQEMYEVVERKGKVKVSEFYKSLLSKVKSPHEVKSLLEGMKEAGMIEVDNGFVKVKSEISRRIK